MKVRVRWLSGVTFAGQSNAGNAVLMDGPSEHGGRQLGFRPMEMLLVGLGGCSAFDVVDILKKARQPVQDCLVEIEAERAGQIPAVFTKIDLHFKVVGEGLKPATVARAVSLSAEKYCSASIMLEQAGVAISHRHEIVESI